MTVAKMAWLKTISVCLSIAIPLLSIFFWLTVYGTHLVDKVETIVVTQNEQGADIKDMKKSIASLRTWIDTVAQRQSDSKRDIDYKFKEQGIMSNRRQQGWMTQHVDPATGKRTMVSSAN